MVEDKELFYNFKDVTNADVSFLIQAINVLGENLTGCELGAYRGYSSMTILDNCSLEKLYLIDSWKPYVDFLKTEPDGKPGYEVNQMESEINEFLCRHHVKYSREKDKVEIIKKDSLEAVHDIEDQSLDFIFFDAMMSEEQTYNEAKAYYSKIKNNGYFMGHDSVAKQQVIEPMIKVKELYNNNNKIFTYNNTFLFKV